MTGSGKTVWLSKLIKYRHEVFHPVPERVIYSYQRYQDIFNTMEGVQFIQGLQKLDYDPNKPTLLICDDQQNSQESLKELEMIYTVDSHHSNMSVIMVTQNLFLRSSQYRTISLNCQYYFIFRSARSTNQVRTLAQQLYTGRGVIDMVTVYKRATSTPFSYVLIDLHPLSPERLRFRTSILPCEGVEFLGSKLTECYTL